MTLITPYSEKIKMENSALQMNSYFKMEECEGIKKEFAKHRKSEVSSVKLETKLCKIQFH